MFFVTVGLLIMLVLLYEIHIVGYRKRLQLETRFEMFKLRDWLRYDALLQRTPVDRWFGYLDTTLTQSISALDSLSIWNMLCLRVAHWFGFLRPTFRSIKAAQDQLSRALRQPENQIVAGLYSSYLASIVSHLYKRHFILFTLIRLLHIADSPSTSTPRTQEFARFYSAAPETSTLAKAIGDDKRIPA